MSKGRLINKILDWEMDQKAVILSGVRVKSQDHLPSVCIMGDSYDTLENCTIRNFPWLDVTLVKAIRCKFENCSFIQGTRFENCCFENCPDIQICGGYMEQCEIDQLETLFAHDMKMIGGTVRNSKGNTEFMMLLENGNLSGVTFENIVLTHGAYLAMGYGNACIEACCIKNCSTDRSDEQWFYIDSVGIILDDWRPFPEDSIYYCVRAYADCICLLRLFHSISFISLDYDLEEDETGLDVLKFILENGNDVKHINIHSAHPIGILQMQEFAETYFPNSKLTFNPM